MKHETGFKFWNIKRRKALQPHANFTALGALICTGRIKQKGQLHVTTSRVNPFLSWVAVKKGFFRNGLIKWRKTSFYSCAWSRFCFTFAYETDFGTEQQSKAVNTYNILLEACLDVSKHGRNRVKSCKYVYTVGSMLACIYKLCVLLQLMLYTFPVCLDPDPFLVGSGSEVSDKKNSRSKINFFLNIVFCANICWSIWIFEKWVDKGTYNSII